MADLPPGSFPSAMRHHASPGVWFRTDRTRRGEALVGVLVPTAHKSALFDIWYAAGIITGPRDQEKEKFLVSAPGRPLYLPASSAAKIGLRFGINPDKGGALYRNELDAHRAFAESARQRIRHTEEENARRATG